MSLVLDQNILVQNSKIKSLLQSILSLLSLLLKISGENFPFNYGLYLFLYSKVKSLGAADSDDDDSAASWVAKSRKKENEKSLAEKRVSYHHSSYNLEKVLNLSDRFEKSLNSVNLFTLILAELNIVTVTENENTSHFQIGVVLLIGRAAWDICFNQSEALVRSG